MRVIQNATAVLPSLIRKLGQVGLNFSECCAYQKADKLTWCKTDSTQRNTQEKNTTTFRKLFLKNNAICEFALLLQYQQSL